MAINYNNLSPEQLFRLKKKAKHQLREISSLRSKITDKETLKTGWEEVLSKINKAIQRKTQIPT